MNLLRQFIDQRRQRHRYESLFSPSDAARLLKTSPQNNTNDFQVTLLSARLPGATGRDWPLYLRPGSTDLDVLNSVFFRRDYQLPASRQSERLLAEYQSILDRGAYPLILDCGANAGFSAVWFKLLFPGAVLVSVEPAAENLSMLEKNLAGTDTCIIVAGAVHNRAGTARLVDSGTGEWGFQIEAEGSGTRGAIPLYPVPDLLALAAKRFPNRTLVPWLCKVDIEGGEQELFKEAEGWFTQFSLFAIELHDAHFPGRQSSRPFLNMVVKYGFEVIFNQELIFAFRPVVTQK
jgi:FkbM family methyltransferase